MNYKIQNLTKLLLNLPNYIKKIIVIFGDVILNILSLWISFYLRLDEIIQIQDGAKLAAIISVFIALPVFWLFGYYKNIFRYSNQEFLKSIFLPIIIYTTLYFFMISIYKINGVPRSIGILHPIIFFLMIYISRLGIQFIFKKKQQNLHLNKIAFKAIIYGAGHTGQKLALDLEKQTEIQLVGFIDDDKNLHERYLYKKKIYSSDNLDNLIKTYKVTHVFLALPSIDRNRRLQILNKINVYKVFIRTVPKISDLVNGKVAIKDIKDLEIEDLLGRKAITPDYKLLNKNINSKTVLITGAGGSIGSELCKQIVKLNPNKILLLDVSEYALYEINNKIKNLTDELNIFNTQVIPLIGSIQDKVRMKEIINTFKPDTIYHAAAYKHVPLVEENICEGIKNNVFGTLVCCQIAIQEEVSDFVLISSDKAVRPTSIMGASKRLSELCLQALFHNLKIPTTKLSIVRFGNVIGSSGSVIPKFKQQIFNGGPVTLTHKDVNRFFMTVTEAAQLVIQAGAMAEGSDVFVLDMGDPVKIKDLIIKMINLSGLTLKEDNKNGDIEIKIIGLRPGEKLYEELFLGNNLQITDHVKIMKAHEEFMPWNDLEPNLNKLEYAIKKNEIQAILKLLNEIIKDYKTSDTIVDQVFLKRDNVNEKTYF